MQLGYPGYGTDAEAPIIVPSCVSSNCKPIASGQLSFGGGGVVAASMDDTSVINKSESDKYDYR